MITPHEMFELHSPDTVAETYEGVMAAGLYERLWEMVEHYDDREMPETPDTFYGHVFGDELIKFWDHFTDEEKLALNKIAEANYPTEESL